jgi:hypothetical protein
MGLEQAINFLLVIFAVLYSSRDGVHSIRGGMVLLGFGAMFVLAQFGFNRFFLVDTRPTPLSIADVLLMREIYYSVALVVMGYISVGTGLISIAHALFHRLKNPQQSPRDDFVDVKKPRP